MFKKRLLTLLIGSAFLFGFGGKAVASDFVSVGVSVPMQVKGDGTAAVSASGLIAYVKFPFLGGFGLEDYEFAYDGSNGGKLTYGVSMYDVFYQFPIPIVNITLGVGAGNITPKDDLESYYDAGTATQVFARVGIPFGLFDVHLSSHNVSSTLKGKSVSGLTLSDQDIKFTTTALGVSIGF